MVELNEEARSYLISDDGISAMMSQYGSPTAASTMSAVDYGIPLIVDGLKRRAEDSAGIVNLLNLVRSLDTSQIGTAAMWSRASHRSDMGPDLLEIIFRDSRGNVAHSTIVRKLAERARMSEATAYGILGSSAWMVLAVVVNRYSRSLDRQTLLRVTSQERRVLSEQGWDPWIRSVEWEQSAVTNNDTIFTGSMPEVRPNTAAAPTAAPASASADRAGRYPPPAGRGNRGDSTSAPLSSDPLGGTRGPERGGPYGDPGASGPGVGGYAPPQRPRGQTGPTDYAPPLGGDFADGRQGTRHRPMVQPQSMPPRHTRPRVAAPDPEPRRWPIAIAIGALLLLAGGAWWLLGRGGDGTDSSDQVTAPVDSDADAADDAASGAGDVADPAADDTTASTVDPGGYTGVVSMEVPMKDIFAFETTNAAGGATVTIDANSGEACAFVSTTNLSGTYRSHIHLGSYPENGPIVVDFEPMSDGVEQCVANDLNDINDVLADPSEFYVEMHDASEEFTVRGQLSEATFYEDLRDPALIPDPNEGGGAAFDTDPDQNGAVVRFAGASLVVQGTVSDQMIVDSLTGSLEASGVPVTNELRVEADAPPPSGKFVANEGLTFPIGGDQLQGDNSEVLQTMAKVIQANPGWKLTVVGHTDDTGKRTDNLELSRRRALSVRAALEELGVSKDVLKVAGFGPDQPVGDNGTPGGRQRNRRIEFIIDPT